MTLTTCLTVFVNDPQGSDDFAAHISVNIQIWNGTTHVTTIPLLNGRDFEASQLGQDVPLEMWASHTARQVARVLEDAFFKNAETKAFHYLSDFQMVTQVTSTPEQ